MERKKERTNERKIKRQKGKKARKEREYREGERTIDRDRWIKTAQEGGRERDQLIRNDT